MSKKIDDFFNAYPGLDLIQNPKKSKRTKCFVFQSEENKDSSEEDNSPPISDPVTLYKNEILRHLESFTIPLPPPKKTDSLDNLLELGYYYFISHNLPTTVSHRSIGQNSVIRENHDLVSKDQVSQDDESEIAIIQGVIDDLLDKVIDVKVDY